MKPPHFNTVWEYDYSLTPGKGMSLLHVFQIQKEHKMCREALSTVIQRYNNVQKLNMPLKTTKEFLSFHLIYLLRNPLLSFIFITYCIYCNSRFPWANLSWNTYAINLVCLKYVFFLSISFYLLWDLLTFSINWFCMTVTCLVKLLRWESNITVLVKVSEGLTPLFACHHPQRHLLSEQLKSPFLVNCAVRFFWEFSDLEIAQWSFQKYFLLNTKMIVYNVPRKQIFIWKIQLQILKHEKRKKCSIFGGKAVCHILSESNFQTKDFIYLRKHKQMFQVWVDTSF